MFTKKDDLLFAERAAVNGIDISNYITYPRDIQDVILSDMEEGCTSRQVDKALMENENPDALKKELQGLVGHPDIKTFKKYLCPENIKEPGEDCRRLFKKWDTLLQEPKCGWQTERSSYSLDLAQKGLDEDDRLSMRSMFPYYLAIDEMIKDKSHVDFATYLDNVGQKIGVLLSSPGFKQTEMLACYTGSSGISSETALNCCEKLLQAGSYSVDETYILLFDCAVYINIKKYGFLNGMRFYEEKMPPVRYRTKILGGFKKYIVSEPCKQTPSAMQNICEAIKKDIRHPLKYLADNGGARNDFILMESLNKNPENDLDGFIHLNRSMERQLEEILDVFA